MLEINCSKDFNESSDEEKENCVNGNTTPTENIHVVFVDVPTPSGYTASRDIEKIKQTEGILKSL